MPPTFFRITLLRSSIGLPGKISGVLRALGLRKRLRTVYHPVSPQVAGQIFAVKELVDVQEVDQALTKDEVKELRRPEKGFWVEQRAGEENVSAKARKLMTKKGPRRIRNTSTEGWAG